MVSSIQGLLGVVAYVTLLSAVVVDVGVEVPVGQLRCQHLLGTFEISLVHNWLFRHDPGSLNLSHCITSIDNGHVLVVCVQHIIVWIGWEGHAEEGDAALALLISGVVALSNASDSGSLASLLRRFLWELVCVTNFDGSIIVW